MKQFSFPGRGLGAALLLTFASVAAQAQTSSVGIGTTAPDAAAALDIVSSSKGLLVPRLTAAARAAIAAPVPAGLLVYQTDGTQPGFWYYEGTAGWTYLNPAGSGDNLGNHTATQNIGLNGNWLSNAVGNNNGLRINNGGGVGIGTSNADTGLHVRTDEKPSISGTEGVFLSGGASGNPNIELRGTNGFAYLDFANDLTSDFNGRIMSSPIGMGLYINSNTSPRLLVTPSGGVRISTLAGGGIRVILTDNSGNLSAAPIPAPQVLGLSGTTLSLSGGGGSVTLPTGGSTTGDNLGNHTATQNIGLNNFWLSNTTGSSTGIRIDSTGRVGIGVAAPGAALDVSAGLLVRGAELIRNQGTYLQWNRSGNQGETWLLNQRGTGPGGIRFGQSDAVSTGTNSVTEWGRFDTNGNLGVGTANPSQKLDVEGGILARGNGLISNQGAYLHWNRNNGDGATWLLNQQGGGFGGIIFGQSNNVSTGNNTVAEWGRFSGSGNLGLGTAAPSQKLDVRGNLRLGDDGGNAAGTGQAVEFVGPGVNTDPVGLYRVNPAADQSELRVVVGDGADANDKFSVGRTSGYTEGQIPGGTFTPNFTVQSDGQVKVANLAGTGTRVVVANTDGTLSSAAAGSVGDNLGNHTATQNLNLADKQLVGNGGTAGLAVSSAGSVGIGTTAPAASAQLDVSSSTKGFLPPRLAQPERDAIASPAPGLVIYNTNSNKLNVWNGTRWTESISSVSVAEAVPEQFTTFAFTGGEQIYTVPNGVSTIDVDAAGAAGGPAGAPAAPGGRVQTTLSVTPGEVLRIYVGGAGSLAVSTDGAGYNGGGPANSRNGGGGGGTDIRRGGAAVANRIVVAGGGGGGSGGELGGAGGGLTGGTGSGDLPGQGGTQTAGGAGGAGIGAGSLFQGGAGNFSGGGGGYYGGGGGSSSGLTGGGGGGSSFVLASGSSGTVHTQGYRSGDGQVIIRAGIAYATPALNGVNFLNVPAASLTGVVPAASLPALTSSASGSSRTISLGTGNSTTFSVGDNLGNHTATQNLDLGANQLVGNGGTSGLTIASSGAVTTAGALATGGNASVGGTLTTTGNTTVGGTLTATGATRLASLAGTGSRVVTTAADGTLGSSALPVDTDAQQLSKSGNTISLTNGGSVTDSDNQTLGLSSDVLSLTNGGSITLPDASATNELQTISKAGSTVTLSNGGGTFTDADNQALSISSGVVSLTSGGSITLPDASATNEAQTLSKAGSTVTLSAVSGTGGGTFTDSDNQTLSISGSVISLSSGGSVTVPAGADNLGSHTATQALNLATFPLVGNGGTTGLTISSAGAVTTAGTLTTGGNATVNGTLTTTGNTSLGGTLTATGTTRLASLTGTGSRMVTTAADGTLGSSALPVDTDAQQLSISGSTISISGVTGTGSSITVPSSADNMGNHTATTNIGLSNNWLSNAPGNANGIRVDNSGNVGVGISIPTQRLDVGGGILARASSPISNQGAYLHWNRSGGDGETWLLNQRGGGPGGIRFGAATTADAITEWARFDASGNLGIGNNNPGQKLDVGGNANVSGTTTVGGNLGLGITIPTQKLDVRGNVRLGADGGNVTGLGQTVEFVGPGFNTDPVGFYRTNPGADASELRVVVGDAADVNDKFVVGRSSANAEGGLAAGTFTPSFTVRSDGNVGIGTSIPNYKLDVAGDIRVNTTVYTSDARFKTNVRPIGSALSSVLALRGVRYEWNALGVKHGGKAGAGQVGVIAQEVEKIYPELVSTDADGFKAVNYAQLTPVLIEAIKELKAENEALKQQATADKAQTTATLESLAERLRALEAGGGQARK